MYKYSVHTVNISHTLNNRHSEKRKKKKRKSMNHFPINKTTTKPPPGKSRPRPSKEEVGCPERRTNGQPDSPLPAYWLCCRQLKPLSVSQADVTLVQSDARAARPQ